MRCSRCGTELPDDARFCSSCGASVAGPVAEERKFVSVLFVDVVGSTARADGADPEDVRDRNQLYYREVRERIERHGGTIEKYVGDAVMAVFGAPLARSDDAERAVRASLSILDGIAALNERDPNLDLKVRVAVCTGEAIVSVDAAPADALATGDVVNTAARLQTAAPVGSAVVGEETYRLTRHAFDYRELAAVDAKGKRDPVPAWLVERSLVSPAERPTSTTPLVGREREVLLIRTIWERAVSAGSPHLVTVIGPAGIGKSRLAEEVSAVVEDRGERVLWGRSLPYEEQTPYRAFGQILRRAAGIYETDGVDMARQKLGALVGSLFPEGEAADATRYLSLLLGLGVGEPVSEAIHLLFAGRRTVELLAERGPLLLVFEDVHWADDSLLDLIDYLISHVHDHPVAFLALARPEFLEVRPRWGAGVVGQTTLTLDPLTTLEATEVVGTLLAGAEPSTVAKVVADGGREPAVHRGTGGCARGRDGRRRTAGHRARRDRGADRRAAAGCEDRAAPRLRDRAIVLERRARRDRRVGRCGDVPGGPRGARPRPATPAQPGRGRRGVRVQARVDPRRRVRHAPPRAPTRAARHRGARDRGVGPRSHGARMGPGVSLARRRRTGPGDRVPPRGR